MNSQFTFKSCLICYILPTHTHTRAHSLSLRREEHLYTFALSHTLAIYEMCFHPEAETSTMAFLDHCSQDRSHTQKHVFTPLTSQSEASPPPIAYPYWGVFHSFTIPPALSFTFVLQICLCFID